MADYREQGPSQTCKSRRQHPSGRAGGPGSPMAWSAQTLIYLIISLCEKQRRCCPLCLNLGTALVESINYGCIVSTEMWIGPGFYCQYSLTMEPWEIPFKTCHGSIPLLRIMIRVDGMEVFLLQHLIFMQWWEIKTISLHYSAKDMNKWTQWASWPLVS